MSLDRVIFKLCGCQTFRGPFDSYEELFRTCFSKAPPSMKPNLKPGKIFSRLIGRFDRCTPFPRDQQPGVTRVNQEEREYLFPSLDLGRRRYLDSFEVVLRYREAFDQIWNFSDLPKEIYFYMTSIWNRYLYDDLVEVIQPDLIKQDPILFLLSYGSPYHYSRIPDYGKQSSILAFVDRNTMTGPLCQCLEECFFDGITIDTVNRYFEGQFGRVKMLIFKMITLRGFGPIKGTKDLIYLQSSSTMEEAFFDDLFIHCAGKFSDFEEVFFDNYLSLIPSVRRNNGLKKKDPAFPKIISVIKRQLINNRKIFDRRLVYLFLSLGLDEQFYLCGGYNKFPQEAKRFSPPTPELLMRAEQLDFLDSIDPLYDQPVGLVQEVLGVISQHNDLLLWRGIPA